MSVNSARLNSRVHSRRGSITLEAILVIPILFIATLAVGQFFIAVLVRQTVVNASIEGAKTASKGGDLARVRDAVNDVLATVNLTVGPQATVIRETMQTTESLGGVDCSPPTAPDVEIGEVRVTVCVDATAAPLLNALSAFGVNLTGKRLAGSTLLAFE